MNLLFPINETSYGLTALNIIQTLFENDIEYSLFPISRSHLSDNKFDEAIKFGIDSARFYNKNKPSIRLFHQFSLAEKVGNSTHIGFPIFELDIFTNFEKHHLSCCDKLFVTSKWAKKIIFDNGIDVKTEVIPLGVNRNIFNENNQSTSNKTIFLNIGKLEKRKGHDFLPQVFSKTFNQNDNVELWMMIDSLVHSPQEISSYKKSVQDKLGNKVRFLNRTQTAEQLSMIMRSVDCGIFPSRAEGWNLGLLEMMSCGKMIIATNYSGHTEYCNDKNSLLIDITEKELANDGKWFHGQGNWAKIDSNETEQMIEFMRFIHYSKKQSEELLNKQGIETAKKFTWNNTTSNILSKLGD